MRSDQDGNPADKKQRRECSPPKLKLIPPRTWAGEEERETRQFGDVWCLCVKFSTVTHGEEYRLRLPDGNR